MDLEDTAWHNLKETLPVHLDIPEIVKCDIHGVEVSETLDSNETALGAGFVAVNSDDLTVAQKLLSFGTAPTHNLIMVCDLNLILLDVESCSIEDTMQIAFKF